MIGAHARGSCVEGARELFLDKLLPIPSMYGIFTYIWLIFMVNVGKYTIDGWYGLRVKMKIHVLLVLMVQTVSLVFQVDMVKNHYTPVN